MAFGAFDLLLGPTTWEPPALPKMPDRLVSRATGRMPPEALVNTTALLWASGRYETHMDAAVDAMLVIGAACAVNDEVPDAQPNEEKK